MRKVAYAVGLTAVMAAFAGLGGAATTAPAPFAAEASALPSLAPLIERIAPAVVSIAVRGTVAAGRNPLFDDPRFRPFFKAPPGQAGREFQAVGSGVIIDAAQGYVLTNAHVIANADEIGVTLATAATSRPSASAAIRNRTSP